MQLQTCKGWMRQAVLRAKYNAVGPTTTRQRMQAVLSRSGSVTWQAVPNGRQRLRNRRVADTGC